tara:strand:- start:51 stop:272 length:222 start_codon:yes stop_codon:yes gene_type:complete
MGRILSRVLGIIGTLFFFLLLISCGSTPQQSASDASPSDQRTDVSTLQAVDGTSVTFGDFKGQPTVLWFWSPN